MAKRLYGNLILPGLRIGLGVMLIYSGISKGLQPHLFFSAVTGYEMFGMRGSAFLAAIIPWMELTFGICLVTNAMVAGALLGTAGLFAIYSIAIASVLYRHVVTGCGCFSFMEEPVVSYITEVRTLALLFASVLLFIHHYRTISWVSQADRCQSPLFRQAPLDSEHMSI